MKMVDAWRVSVVTRKISVENMVSVLTLMDLTSANAKKGIRVTHQGHLVEILIVVVPTPMEPCHVCATLVTQETLALACAGM